MDTITGCSRNLAMEEVFSAKVNPHWGSLVFKGLARFARWQRFRNRRGVWKTYSTAKNVAES